jgi:hypothetical protein
MFLSWRREHNDPMFVFWRKFQEEASRQARETTETQGSPEDQAKQLWLEHAYLRFTGIPPATIAGVLGRERTEDSGRNTTAVSPDTSEVAVDPHPSADALIAARNTHSAEVYVTMAGHMAGGLLGYTNSSVQRLFALRPALCAVFTGAVLGIFARFAIPEAMVWATTTRSEVVDAQKAFVQFVAREEVAEAERRAQQPSASAEPAE